MVVKYLEKFVEDEVPGGFYQSSLQELINNQISKHGKAIIVMDASSAPIFFSRGLDPVVCNGQLKSVRRNIENFAEKIESYGAELVVYYQGTADYQKLIAWKGKRLDKLKRINAAFDSMYRKEGFPEVQFQLNSGHIVIKNTFLSLNKNCKVFTSTRECDEEVSEFCRENKGTILLAQDSDYMIYDGIEYYVTIKTINLDSLECKVYDKEQLLKYLNLETGDLPLLATLAGNEIVSEFDLRRFHASLCNQKPGERISNRKKVFQAIADFILRNDRNSSLIAQALVRFGFPEKTIKESINMYSKGKDRPELCIDPLEAKVVKVAQERTRTNLLSPTLFCVLTKREFRSNNDLEDIRDKKNKPIARIMRPLRQKIYGILLYDSEKTSVVEYCVEGAMKKGNYCIDEVEVEAEKPRIEHPGVLRLWEDTSPKMQSVKLSLFCEAVGIDPESEEIRSIPPKFLFPTVALCYLLRQPGDNIFRDRQEAECFLTTALVVSGADPDELEKVELNLPNPRAVRLSSLYLRCCGALQMLNEVVGFVVSEEDSCPSNYFDGKMFQKIYSRTESGENFRDILENDTSLIILFKTLCAIIF